ncbi:MAG: GtrA family protein [Gemmataceae bacterium]|nr:GtrA family protein [Gemmataceae bacterium]MCI0743583.1 GtrA family protein [Gemmataceae bacterium]
MCSVPPSDAPKKTLLQRFWILLRSSLVGLCATASDLGTLCLLIYVFGVPDQIANVPSLIPGLVVMFIGNKYFAFEDRSRAIVRQGSLFFAIELVAFGLNALLFFLIRHWFDIHPILARILGSNVVYLGFSFPLWSLLVFRAGRKAEAEPAPQET